MSRTVASPDCIYFEKARRCIQKSFDSHPWIRFRIWGEGRGGGLCRSTPRFRHPPLQRGGLWAPHPSLPWNLGLVVTFISQQSQSSRLSRPSCLSQLSRLGRLGPPLPLLLPSDFAYSTNLSYPVSVSAGLEGLSLHPISPRA